jgi:hypothetical protein
MKTFAIPNTLMKRILDDLRAAIKSERYEEITKGDFFLIQGMLEVLNMVESTLNTWTIHQANLSKLREWGERRRVTKEITLSHGRYRKFEWYEGRRFISLAFLWGNNQPDPEIGLQIQNADTLANEFFVYQGALSYDNLVTAAKKSGIRGIWGAKKTAEWKPSEA